MDFNVLSRIIKLTDSNLPLAERLDGVARLAVRALPFDACAVYAWEPKNRRFTLIASAGERRRRKECYGEKEGLPGQARKLMKAFDATVKDPDEPVCMNVRDDGMKGFRHARVYPLRDGRKLHGVLCLKAARKPALSAKRKDMLDVVATQLTASLRCDQNRCNLRRTLAELRNIQTRFVDAEKLMALGELSATLAHEVKNPLVSIGGFAAGLARRIEPDSPHQTYVVQIVKEVAKLEGLIDDILNFTEDRTLRFSPGELNPIVSDALSLFEDVRRKCRIRLETDMCDKKIGVFADSQQLKIAFDNLIANAIQSMRNGGTLTVTTRKLKQWGVVTITDSGGGIDPGIVCNIFNPFFTTKRAGTGLGLPITHRIITRHKGHIEVTNDYGRGMTFTVKLPCRWGTDGDRA